MLRLSALKDTARIANVVSNAVKVNHNISAVRPSAASISSSFSSNASVDSSSNLSSSSCPFTGSNGNVSSKRDIHSSSLKAKATITAVDEQIKSDKNPEMELPALNELPSLPVVGSFLQVLPVVGQQLANYYNLPSMKKNNAYEYYPTMRERFGDFYSITIPGMGKTYVINDPKEMKKVLSQEGAYPKGGIENLKPFIKWGHSRGLSLMGGTGPGEDAGFFGHGEMWRSVRTFLQTDLLAPQSARGYVPGIVTAAEIASRGAQKYGASGGINLYLNYAAFDMFNAVMFGELTRIADPDFETDPVNAEFVKNSVDSLALLIHQIMDKDELIKGSVFGIETPKYREFAIAMDNVNRIANAKIETFKSKWANDELDDFQRASYIARAFERQAQDDNSLVTEDQMTEICMFLLNAGVDTTSTFIAWALVHLALNPHVQHQLHDELKGNIEQYSSESGGSLNPEMLSRSKAPYLHAVLRESHRLTPVHPQVVNKSNPNSDITIHGQIIPQGSSIAFESFSLGMDPAIVGDDVRCFVPERWYPDAVQQRKGTKAEVLDHQFFKDPFSQGARKCPGSRVAVNETLVFLSQLVLDWEFKFTDTSLSSYQDIEYEQQTLLVPQIPAMSLSPRN